MKIKVINSRTGPKILRSFNWLTLAVQFSLLFKIGLGTVDVFFGTCTEEALELWADRVVVLLPLKTNTSFFFIDFLLFHVLHIYGKCCLWLLLAIFSVLGNFLTFFAILLVVFCFPLCEWIATRNTKGLFKIWGTTFYCTGIAAPYDKPIPRKYHLKLTRIFFSNPLSLYVAKYRKNSIRRRMVGQKNEHGLRSLS